MARGIRFVARFCTKRVQFSHGRVFSDSRNVQKSVTRIIYLGPLPTGKHLIHFLVLKMKGFRNFVLDNCILVFDAEQVYLKLQATNLKNKEITVNPYPQTLEKNWFFETPIP